MGNLPSNASCKTALSLLAALVGGLSLLSLLGVRWVALPSVPLALEALVEEFSLLRARLGVS